MLAKYQRDRGSFSLAFDGTTASNSPHRCIRLSLRTEGSFAGDFILGRNISLELMKISGKATTNIVAREIGKRLQEFSVNLDSFYFASTDAGDTMLSATTKLDSISQPCFIHGLHIAIQRVMKKSPSDTSDSDIGGVLDDDEVEDEYDGSSDDTSGKIHSFW